VSALLVAVLLAAAPERQLVDEVVAVVDTHSITLSELAAETRIRLAMAQGPQAAWAPLDRRVLGASLHNGQLLSLWVGRERDARPFLLLRTAPAVTRATAVLASSARGPEVARDLSGLPQIAALIAPCGSVQSSTCRSCVVPNAVVAAPLPGTRPAPISDSFHAYLPATTVMSVCGAASGRKPPP